MKRVHLLLAAAVFSGSLVGCAGSSARNRELTEKDAQPAAAPVAKSSTTTAAAPAEKPAAPAPEAKKVEACSLSKIYFLYDDATLSDPARQTLRGVADCIRSRKLPVVEVEGHCDERGTQEYNLALGEKRAQAVKRYLTGLGVPSAVQTISFGKEYPAVDGHAESAWKQNRRAELRAAGEKLANGTPVATR